MLDLRDYLAEELSEYPSLVEQTDAFFIHSAHTCFRRRYKHNVIINKRVFPFDKIPKNSRIILYGAGTVGQIYHNQLQKTNYCKTVMWIDKNYLKYKHMNVVDVSRCFDASYDFLVIAVANKKIVGEIHAELLAKGVPSNKIVIGVT